jgi:hypothetical protein
MNVQNNLFGKKIICLFFTVIAVIKLEAQPAKKDYKNIQIIDNQIVFHKLYVIEEGVNDKNKKSAIDIYSACPLGVESPDEVQFLANVLFMSIISNQKAKLLNIIDLPGKTELNPQDLGEIDPRNYQKIGIIYSAKTASIMFYAVNMAVGQNGVYRFVTKDGKLDVIGSESLFEMPVNKFDCSAIIQLFRDMH